MDRARGWVIYGQGLLVRGYFIFAVDQQCGWSVATTTRSACYLYAPQRNRMKITRTLRTHK